MNGKVSVIIPAFNAEEYISTCIESVLKQTYRNFEIIIINDGSTDNTLNILKEYESNHDNIKAIDISNHGQGYGRNLGLSKSTGDYILFLDADDFIEPVTLQMTVEKIEEEKSDLVVFDWKYYYDATGKTKYINIDKFFGKRFLEGEEVLELFKIKHYFTVNKLYLKRFLLDNNIKYGEGFIYEDNPFWANIVINAKKVSLIQAPLYNIRVSKTSTTKTNLDTDIHYKGFITAINEIMNIIQTKKQYSEQYYYLYNYIMKKFNLYYEKRVPKKYRNQFLDDFVEVMGKALELENTNVKNTLIRLSYKLDIFKKQKKRTFRLMYKCFYLKKIVKGKLKKAKSIIKKFVKKVKREKIKISDNMRAYKANLNKEKEDIILFMGFDYRYTGNSRYLFEHVIKQRQDNVFFVTDNEFVDDKYRIKPNTSLMYEKFYKAKYVIFESWTPARFIKTPGTYWIQLWHGTPLKKMLFDSDESNIVEKNKRHKINKYNDICKWDYLTIDNEYVYKYFETSFLLPEDKKISCGYPRVKYLIDNKDNDELKQEIRQNANIDKNKKIVLYLPTWRDYNYGKKEEEMEFDYFIDADELKKHLGDEYQIISKNHSYLNNETSGSITNVDVETQELLLIADYLITDYSSVMFDGFAIDIPVIVFSNDFEKYEQSRGVYPSIWKVLTPFITETEQGIAEKIRDYNMDCEEYKEMKTNFSYKSEKDLVDLLLNNKLEKVEEKEERLL